MVTVRFESLHGQDHVFFPDLATEFGVPSDANPDYVQERELTDEQAAIALSNPNFVDAATGKNPNFTCDDCGKFHTHTVRTKAGIDTSPICAACAAEANGAPAAAIAAPTAAADTSPNAQPGSTAPRLLSTPTVVEAAGTEEIK